MPPRGNGRGGRGGRGGAAPKLKFQPKSNLRSSKEERDAAERKERAAIQAEEAAVERERKKVEARAARGRGRGGGPSGRGRGGAAGGVSGWMSGQDGGGHLSGSMYVEKMPSVRLPGFGKGDSSGEYVSGPSGQGTGRSDGIGGGRGTNKDANGSNGLVWTPRNEDNMLRPDGSKKRFQDIETINLISDDEDEDEDDDVNDGSRKRKTRARQSPLGLPPVRVARHEHVPRRAKVNIDLDTLPKEDQAKAREVAADTASMPTKTVPIKIEDSDDVIVVPKAEPASPKARKKGKGRSRGNAAPQAAANAANAAEEPEVMVTDSPTSSPSKPRARPLTREELKKGMDITRTQPVERPFFVRDDCNFTCAPRPISWESKDDTDNWERNIRKMYAVYEELSFPEKMLKEGAAAGALDSISRDIDMAIAGTAHEDKGKSKGKDQDDIKEGAATEENKIDRKQDLVYIFQVAPGVPGIEGLRTKESIEKSSSSSRQEAAKDSEGGADVSVISRPSSPKASRRANSPEASRKKKGATTAATAKPEGTGAKSVRVKQEDGARVKAEGGDAPVEVKDDSDRHGRRHGGGGGGGSDGDPEERPGYIGDLVVYNTGEARMDWGGLPLHLKMGLQSNMLQQVLLASGPVTRDAALRAQQEKEAAEKARRAIKKEKPDGHDEPGPGDGGGEPGTSGRPRPRKDDDGDEMMDNDDDDNDNDAPVHVSTAPVARMGNAPPPGGADAKDQDPDRDADKMFAMGSVAGSFEAVPDFNALFGSLWV